MPDSLGPQDLAAIADDGLLLSLLVKTPVCDIALERLLTRARVAMLDLAMTTTANDISDAVLNFCCALAQQCFINEYVFAHGREEQDRAQALRDRLAAALAADDAVPALTIAAVAAYFPLHSVDARPARFERSWPQPAGRLVVQQVEEPAEERSLRSSIPILTPIVDSVSALVREQYEENPYPRWIATSSLDMQLNFDEHISSQFPRATFTKLGRSDVEILIVGCGTGRQAIETARRHGGVRILAIDLSLASLSYAVRKARELRVANIAFAQADLLELGRLGQTFDVIEAVGVLHHLRNPQEGWRVLVALLRRGGFMRIGLYSALARQHIRAAHAFIAERRYGQTAEAIRQFRQDLLDLDEGNPLKQVAESSDFFTISRCRDLLFHVQEHHTSIPAIKSFLAANNLAFLGFEGLADRHCEGLYPHDMAMADLDRWHGFEKEHPTTFDRMYQFWAQQQPKPR